MSKEDPNFLKDDLLWRYLINDLSTEERRSFEGQLAKSERLRTELSKLELLVSVVKEEADKRAPSLPALSQQFFDNLPAQPAVNGSSAIVNSIVEENEPMATITFPEKAQKPRRQGQFVTAAVAVIAAAVFGLILLMTGSGQNDPDDNPIFGGSNAALTHTPPPTPLPSRTIPPSATFVMTATPIASIDPITNLQVTLDPSAGAITLIPPEQLLLLTATALVQEATQQVLNLTATAIPPSRALSTSTPVPTSSNGFELTATAIVSEATLRALGITATSVPQSMPVATFTPSSTSLPGTMQSPSNNLRPNPALSITPSQRRPIIAAPAVLLDEAKLPAGDFSADAAWSPDGETIAVAGSAGVWLYNADQLAGAAQFLPDNGGTGYLSVAYSPDGQSLAAMDWDKTVSIWETNAYTLRESIPQTNLWWDLQYSPDSNHIIANSSTSQLTISGSDTTVEAIPTDINLSTRFLTFHPSEGQVAAITNAGNVAIISTRTGQVQNQFDVGSTNVNRFVFSGDGSTLAIGSTDGLMQIVDVETGEETHRTSLDGLITEVTYHPTENKVAVIVRTQSLQSVWLWDVETGSQSAAVVYDVGLDSTVFSPDGDRLLVTTEDGNLFILDTSNFG